jgi:hypothetical protein
MNDISTQFGFQHPMRRDRVIKKRGSAAAGLITSIVLLLSIVVAATAVSIGIARAGALTSIGERDGNTLWLAIFLGLVLVGMGGITAAFTTRRATRRG